LLLNLNLLGNRLISIDFTDWHINGDLKATI